MYMGTFQLLMVFIDDSCTMGGFVYMQSDTFIGWILIFSYMELSSYDVAQSDDFQIFALFRDKYMK